MMIHHLNDVNLKIWVGSGNDNFGIDTMDKKLLLAIYSRSAVSTMTLRLRTTFLEEPSLTDSPGRC